MIDGLIETMPFARTGGARHRRREVFRHGEIGKYLFALRHQHNTPSGDIVWRSVIDSRSSKINDPFSDARVVNAQETGNRAQRRGLPRAVSADDRNDLPFSDPHRNALERSNRAVDDD